MRKLDVITWCIAITGLVLSIISLVELVDEYNLSVAAGHLINAVNFTDVSTATATIWSLGGNLTTATYTRTTYPLKKGTIQWDLMCLRNSDFKNGARGTVIRRGYESAVPILGTNYNYVKTYPFVIVGMNGTGSSQCFECSANALCYCFNRATKNEKTGAYCSTELPVDGWVKLWPNCDATADAIMSSLELTGQRGVLTKVAFSFSVLLIFASFSKSYVASVAPGTDFQYNVLIGSWIFNLVFFGIMATIYEFNNEYLAIPAGPGCPSELTEASDLLKTVYEKDYIAFVIACLDTWVVPVVSCLIGAWFGDLYDAANATNDIVDKLSAI